MRSRTKALPCRSSGLGRPAAGRALAIREADMRDWSDDIDDVSDDNPANYDLRGRFRPHQQARTEHSQITHEKFDDELRPRHDWQPPASPAIRR